MILWVFHRLFYGNLFIGERFFPVSGSLDASCTSDGRLYLFDRASKNPFKYNLFNTKHNISSMIECNPAHPHSVRILKAKSISMSMGSIIELNKEMEIRESIQLLMQNRSDSEESDPFAFGGSIFLNDKQATRH